MYWVDFKFIKIVEDCFIFGIDVPVVSQSLEEPVMADKFIQHTIFLAGYQLDSLNGR